MKLSYLFSNIIEAETFCASVFLQRDSKFTESDFNRIYYGPHYNNKLKKEQTNSSIFCISVELS